MPHFPDFTTLPKIWLLKKVIVSCNGRVIFKQYIPKKCKHFSIKIFKLCDSTGYTYDMKVYLGKDRQHMAQHVTATHATVTELMRKIEGHSHKLYMDILFPSPELFDDLAKKQIYCCGTVRPNRRGMPQDLVPKTLKLKRVHIRVRTSADLTVILWWDKRDICLLMNIHNAPAEGNFYNEGGKAIKPQIVMDYNHHMGYVDKSDRIANSYSISCRTFKWMKKLFFRMLDLAILDSYILHSSCGGKKISHRDFQYTLMRNRTRTECTKAIRQTTHVEPHVARLKVFGSKHWPIPCETQLRCDMCKARSVTQKVFVKCQMCEMGLCVKKNMF